MLDRIPSADTTTGAAGDSMVVRKISEMYDMRTNVGSMGIIGIHTPRWEQISRRWYGEFFTYRYFRILGCNITLACAAQLPADPLQIGTESGTVAPQDMMNPILYRAMSNDSWNAALNRLYAVSGADVDTNSVRAFYSVFSGLTSTQHEDAYYAMLSSDEWKKALPQQGLSMRHLVPYVYSLYSVMGAGALLNGYGESSPPSASVNGTAAGGGPASVTSPSGANTDRVVRGGARPMPRIPTAHGDIKYSDDTNLPYVASAGIVPRTYVAALLLPPATRSGSQFYFRMKIDWFIEFTEPVSLLDRINASNAATQGSYTYYRGYTVTSSKLDAVPLQDDAGVGSVDYLGVDEPRLIVEK